MPINPERLFFTSDTHFGHANIIKYCDRPFVDVDEMNKIMVQNINHYCGPDDTLIHLGDFCWWREGQLAQWRDTLVCNDIRLVLGNHDAKKPGGHPDPMLYKYFESVWEMHELSVRLPASGENQHIVLCHYPLRSWNRKFHGSWHLYGHAHQHDASWGKSLNMGVDQWEYRPVHLREIEEKMEGQQHLK